jgi:hypothetical protein
VENLPVIRWAWEAWLNLDGPCPQLLERIKQHRNDVEFINLSSFLSLYRPRFSKDVLKSPENNEAELIDLAQLLQINERAGGFEVLCPNDPFCVIQCRAYRGGVGIVMHQSNQARIPFIHVRVSWRFGSPETKIVRPSSVACHKSKRQSGSPICNRNER